MGLQYALHRLAKLMDSTTIKGEWRNQLSVVHYNVCYDQGKWWVTDTPQDDQDTEEIKIEVEKIGLDYLPADIKKFYKQNRDDQRRQRSKEP